MSAPNDGGPAFPVSTGHHPDTMMKDPRIGMTLRDYFAAEALKGLLSDNETIAATYRTAKKAGVGLSKAMAASSYEFADAMLAERGRQ